MVKGTAWTGPNEQKQTNDSSRTIPHPPHRLEVELLARKDDAVSEDAAWLLLDQALLMEGIPLKDPAAFVQRLNRVLNLSM